ncbi:MAG: hypothetical protein ACE5D6_06340, partial [Candidatus Zixiibacteriota bacterium]
AALADANLAKKIWDTDIDATLKSLVISNSAGDAVQLTGGGGGGSGLNATGAGSGNGIRATGGLTASGIWAQGGATNGNGINAKAGAGSNQHGLSLSGDGAGYDLYMKNDGGGLTTDTLNAIIDSLQNQDNWVARSSHADSLMDSVQYNIIQSTNAAVDVANINGWSPITDNDSLIVDQSSLEDMVNTLTAAEIADTISNRDSSMYLDGYWHKIANRADSGAFFLGDGGYSVSVQLYDTTISQIIAGATIAVRNLSQSSLVAISTSDNNGLASFNLNADSFLMVASSPGYLFNPYDTVIITGSSTDTVYGAQFNPGTPVSPNLCRVFGYLYDLNGSPDQEATVTAFLPAGVVRYDSLIISPYKVTSTTDSAGYFYLDLIPTDSLIPSGVSYEFTISRKDGTILRQRLTVPDTSNWRLVW